MTFRLHADHVDASGAYGQKFELIKELIDKGALTEIPQEFRVRDEEPVIRTSTKQTVVSNENKFDMSNGHADHVDETGEYNRIWEEKYGQFSQAPVDEKTGENTWKSFLQQIIAEEKRKLNI